MTEEIVLEYHVSAFRGKPPEIDIADGVDMEGIQQRDANAMFVTLPIAEIGAISNNGLLYDEALVDSIAEQINTKRPGGIFGHLKEEDRSTSFPLPAGLWVGAARSEQTLWAKAYIPPSAARDYVQNLKAVGGQIATSIYGKGKFEKVRDGVRRLTNFKLESLDFAPPSRAALGLAATPHVTAEMNNEQEPIMADKAQVIAELTVTDIAAIPAAVRDAIVAEASKQDETQATIAELTSTVEAKEVVISEQNKLIESYRMERLTATIEGRVAELTDWQVTDDAGKEKLKKMRELLKGQILTRLGSDPQASRVAEMADAAWEDLKPIAEMLRDALSGPPAIVNGKVRETGRKPLEDTPENRIRAAAAMGINI